MYLALSQFHYTLEIFYFYIYYHVNSTYFIYCMCDDVDLKKILELMCADGNIFAGIACLMVYNFMFTFLYN